MRLRWQLLLVSLLTLALPWAGWRYTVAVERAQRADRQGNLLENAALVERIVSARLERLPDPLLETERRDPRQELSARPLRGPVLIDGYMDDWRAGEASASISPNEDIARWQVALDERFFYLFVEATDATPRYRAAPLAGDASHDVLIMVFDAPDGARTYARIDTPAPGPVSARHLRDDDTLPRIRGFWRSAPGGHAIEVRLPLDMVGDRFGFALLDADEDGIYRKAIGSMAPSLELSAAARPVTVSAWRSLQPGLLIRPATRVSALLDQLRRPGQRLSVIDSAGWRVATAGRLDDAIDDDPVPTTPRRSVPFAGALLRVLLQREDADMPTVDVTTARPELASLQSALGGESAGLRYRAGDVQQARPVVLSAAHPIRGRNDVVLGAILIEQSTDRYLTLNTPAFSGLIQTTLLATVIAATGLLAYATLLSVRIARLTRAAERAADGVLRPGTSLSTAMPLTRAGDELGDLARSFQVLLQRLREQTDYLQTLAQTLSHELRTPLTIVKSSLENLSQDLTASEQRQYLDRAAGGAHRLSAILKAMSEATRLEQSLASVEFEGFDLRALVQGMHGGYTHAYGDSTFVLALPESNTCPMRGAPELVAQLLDKLVDNAVSFSPPRRPIMLRLECASTEYCLVVRNEGPPLPKDMQSRLFDSMVSVRQGSARREGDDGADSPHLGLGLYLVRLIAQIHGGSVHAADVENPTGVSFTVRLPR